MIDALFVSSIFGVFFCFAEKGEYDGDYQMHGPAQVVF
jgi:hypothetical protein